MKKLLITLGVLVVLLVAIVVILPFAIPTDVYTSRIAALVQSSTGRSLTISGPVKLSLLPQLRLDAQNVALANAPGGVSPQMVQIKEFQAELRLMPLLRGDLEVVRFVLIEPVIALEVDKAGHPNWVFAKAGAGAAPAAPAAQPGQGATVSAIRLGDVRLQHGKISYRDQRTDEAQELDDIDAKISLPDLDSPSSIDGSAAWNKQKIALTLAVARPRALLEAGTTPVKFSATADPVKLAFDGEVAVPAKLQGAIDVSVPSVRTLANWAGSPIVLGGNGLGPLAIKGKIDAAGSKFAFSDAAIALDAIKANGNLSIDASGARPYLKGQLAVDRLDLNPYLASEAKTPPSAAAPTAPAAASGEEPIDLTPLRGADADFNLSAGALVYRKIQFGQSALVLHLKDGKLTTDLTQLALYGGQGSGSLTLDGSGEVPAMSANFRFSGLQIEPLLVALAGTDRLAGRGAFAISVNARAHSREEMIRTLNGNGSLDLENGAIRGVNLIGAAQAALSALSHGATTSNETAFGSLTGTFTISNGILRNGDLRLTSGPVPVQGAGTVNLAQETVDYRVTVQIAGQVPVPILVTGPIDNLSYRPDVANALENMVKNPGAVLPKGVPVNPKSVPGGAAGGLLNNLLKR